MFTAATTAIATFQMIFFCEDHQTLIIKVIIFFAEAWGTIFLYRLGHSMPVSISYIC